MLAGATGQDSYQNEVKLEMEGRDPPTLSAEARKELATNCKDVNFLQYDKEYGSYVTPVCPRSP